jgi:Ca2+-binding EF-hand superfamily protein
MASGQPERLRRHFELLDADADGHLELGEWEAPARRMLEALGEPSTSPRAQAVVASYRKMWILLAGQAGTGTSTLTLGQFGQAVGSHIVNPQDADFSDALRQAISAVAELFDRDAKGAVTPEGFTSWLKAVGADPSKAQETFRQIDVDDDGDLTIDELMQAVRDYYLGNFDVSVLGGATVTEPQTTRRR